MKTNPNAPTPAPGTPALLYHPDQCRDSPLQHRHVYDERRLEELAASIHAHGYREEFPAVARPIEGIDPSREVELVVGHRRRRAVEIAAIRAQGVTLEQQRGLAPAALKKLLAEVRRTATFPVIVRAMSDEEVVLLQATENFQKASPHPLEEADCYAKYMRLVASRPGHGALSEQGLVEITARELHKDPVQIARTLKLLALGEVARSAFFSNEDLDIRIAFELARRCGASEAAQIRGLELIGLDRDGRMVPGKPVLAFADARRVLAQRFSTPLYPVEAVPFDVTAKDLVPERGACAPCPDRSGNAQLLFHDVNDRDVCTNLECYSAKADAAWKRRAEDHRGRGGEVLSPRETSKQFYPHSGELAHDADYVKIDSRASFDLPPDLTVRALFEKQGQTPAISLARHEGQAFELVRKADAAALVEAAKRQRAKVAPARAPKEERATSGPTPEEKAREQEEAEARAQARLQKKISVEVLATVIEVWPETPNLNQARVLARAAIGAAWDETKNAVVRRRDLKPENGAKASPSELLLAHLDTLPTARDVTGLVVELLFARSLFFAHSEAARETLEAAALAVHVNPDTIAADVAQRQAAGRKAAATKRGAARPASVPPRPVDADPEEELDEDEDPDRPIHRLADLDTEERRGLLLEMDEATDDVLHTEFVRPNDLADRVARTVSAHRDDVRNRIAERLTLGHLRTLPDGRLDLPAKTCRLCDKEGCSWVEGEDPPLCAGCKADMVRIFNLIRETPGISAGRLLSSEPDMGDTIRAGLEDLQRRGKIEKHEGGFRVAKKKKPGAVETDSKPVPNGDASADARAEVVRAACAHDFVSLAVVCQRTGMDETAAQEALVHLFLRGELKKKRSAGMPELYMSAPKTEEETPKAKPPFVRMWAGEGEAHTPRRDDAGKSVCGKKIGKKWGVAPKSVRDCEQCTARRTVMPTFGARAGEEARS